MLQLRPYQREAVDAIPAWFASNDGNPLVVIPTAGGKSLIIATFIRETLEAWPDTKILVVTHVKELIEQNCAELIGFWPQAPAGIYSAGLNKREHKAQVLFCGIQSIHSKANLLQRVDLILIDEAHLVPRNTETMYGKFLGQLKQINPYIKVVGFTATPYRLTEGLLHEGPGAMFAGIAYEASVLDLINQGYLCRPTSRKAQRQIDTRGVKTVGGEFAAGQLEAVALNPDTVEAIVDEIIAASADRKGWLIFGCGVKHCEVMHAALTERGIACGVIFGDTPPTERAKIIADFKAQKLRALCSMGVLTTGFNARHVDLIAIARPTKSVGLYIQIVGRGTRLHPDKNDCLILDFGGNITRHGPIDQPVVKQKTGSEKGEMPLKKCPECEEPNKLTARQCFNCGFEFPPPEKQVEIYAGIGAMLSSDIKPEWVIVDKVTYTRHDKAGGQPSLCVSYWCGLTTHKEWICFEHTGYARAKAVTWWQARAAQPVPNTVNEALKCHSYLRQPTEIMVRAKGKYTEIVKYKWPV